MHEITAIIAALDISHNPLMVRLAQNAALPVGTTFLLQIAAGDADAIAKASSKTGRSEARLREAAGFFIEQVLLHPDCDSYRTLGAASGASSTELRRNMALLLKWLHPDVSHANGMHTDQLDRTVFANRVTQAWEDLKTEDRRTAYDEKLSRQSRPLAKPRKVRSKRPVSRGRAREHGAMTLWQDVRDPFVLRLFKAVFRGR